LLADKIEQKEKGVDSRAALKAEAARKKKASKMKKTRRKYRDLDGKEGVIEGLEEEEEAGEGLEDTRAAGGSAMAEEKGPAL
jgi:hypothetical protein